MPEIIKEDMNVDDRREKILELLAKQHKIKVADLSRLFGISEVTVRNDLSQLEAANLLERIHGGAISTNKAYYNMSLNDRMQTHVEEKKRIALEVSKMISEGDTIMVNSGTTTLYAVKELKNVKNLTIVTNSISILYEMGYCNNIQVILLGGNVNHQYLFTYGDDAISQLRRYKADKLILSVDGINMEEGITTYHHLEAEVNRQMISRVNKTIVAADYSKIGRSSFAHIDTLDKVDYLVTNNTSGKIYNDIFSETGIEIILA